MLSNKDLKQAVELIETSTNILITTHTKPDGDGSGAIAALTEQFKTMQKHVTPLLLTCLPQWYEFIFKDMPSVAEKSCSAAYLDQFDLIVLVDVNSANQLGDFAKLLANTKTKILVIDHHITNDGLGGLELIDTSASATGLMVFDLFNFAGWKITESIATALFVAVCTDTGWFHFGNADARTYKSSADLIEKGADPARIYHNIYENFSPQRFKLMTKMMRTMTLDLDQRYASQYLLKEDFNETGASYSDTENFIDLCRKIKTVEIATLFVEFSDGTIKCSLRSSSDVDVREIAQKFGGGGHKRASGTLLEPPLKNAKKLIFDLVKEQLDEIKV